MDTGAGSSYASAALFKSIGTSPVRRQMRQTEMLLHTTSRKIGVYNPTISNQGGSFKLNVDIHKVETDILLAESNPEYKKLLQSYIHLREVFTDDDDSKPELLVYIALGTSDFSKITTKMQASSGKIGEPVAELTKFVWVIMSPVQEDHSNAYLT